MKIVIDIPEEMYKNLQKRSTELQAEGYSLENSVLNGTPLPQEPKTGHWIDTNGGVECNKCGKWYPHAHIAKNEIKFCCECGARMVESQKSEG